MLGNNIWVTDGKETKQFSCTQVLPDPVDVEDRELALLPKGFQYIDTGEIPGIFVTDVIHAASPLNNDPSFNERKDKEICGLIDKGTFIIVRRDRIRKDANLLGGRFFLAIKHLDKTSGLQGIIFCARPPRPVNIDSHPQRVDNTTAFGSYSGFYSSDSPL